MDDNFGVVESMGVASGWNLWVWLECIIVVSGCCYKEVYTCRYLASKASPSRERGSEHLPR